MKGHSITAAAKRHNRVSHADLRRLVLEMRVKGWSWVHTASGHLKWSHPEVQGPVFTACTARANGILKERQKLNTALRRAREATSCPIP